MPSPTPEQQAAIRALLAERRARQYGQSRFAAATRRAAWRMARGA